MVDMVDLCCVHNVELPSFVWLQQIQQRNFALGFAVKVQTEKCFHREFNFSLLPALSLSLSLPLSPLFFSLSFLFYQYFSRSGAVVPPALSASASLHALV